MVIGCGIRMPVTDIDDLMIINKSEGVKSKEKDEVNSTLFDKRHIEIGISALKQLINNSETIRHLKF